MIHAVSSGATWTLSLRNFLCTCKTQVQSTFATSQCTITFATSQCTITFATSQCTNRRIAVYIMLRCCAVLMCPSKRVHSNSLTVRSIASYGAALQWIIFWFNDEDAQHSMQNMSTLRTVMIFGSRNSLYTYIHTYTHTYIDYAMNHKNKQIIQ